MRFREKLKEIHDNLNGAGQSIADLADLWTHNPGLHALIDEKLITEASESVFKLFERLSELLAFLEEADREAG